MLSFVDVRDSSGLTATYKRPRLAKLYRTFISEMAAVLNSCASVREVNIVGDCVWASYNTPKKLNINEIFSVAAKANTLMKLLNAQLTKRQYEPIRAGIGVDYGRVLMIKAGYAGSGINDVVYMGDVVNSAAHLAHEAGRGLWEPPMWFGSDVHLNLTEHNQGLLTGKWDGSGTIYTGDVINIPMNDWIGETF